jgi:Tfp pilus assembly major pilin PilA
MSFVEVLIVGGVLTVVASVALPIFRTTVKSTARPTLVSEISRLETAKEQFAVERKLKAGDDVGLDELLRSGCLESSPRLAGVHFNIGKVGMPTSYQFENIASD